MYLRSATPVLRATVDVPRGNATAEFTLVEVDSGEILWSAGRTAAQAGGSDHTARVPELGLHEDVLYRWTVVGYDVDGSASAPASCDVIFDLTSPAVPHVEAVDDGGVVYLDGISSGGIGQTGTFHFTNNGSEDVVGYMYSFLTDSMGAYVEAEPGVVTFAPVIDGPHTLHVQAVDRAGRTSPVQTYRVVVAMASMVDHWWLDEGEGAVAYSTSGSAGQELHLADGVTWGDGLYASFGFDPYDRGLVFGPGTGGAASTDPGVATASYSVGAIVQLDDASGTATAVSQDGGVASAFELGFRHDARCSGGSGCWAFAVTGADGVVSVATSDVPAVEGAWYGLVGVRNSVTGASTVHVCDLGTADSPKPGWPVEGRTITAPQARAHEGPFRLGHGRSDAGDVHPWVGTVSAVRTWSGPISTSTIRRFCI
ncbi:LamG-like jellyroll fold domain-containing protein [Cellulomonas bogoriensis]|uniref:LamG-like jellyroll fold domain-containing protein n=1 Tax=Cellulomonas bogoriensis TaxID=301388 RepID=UPI0009FC05EF|nr:LamG-like jellyroll fold domain-containing protein [Cellulomonas bogoriensis]